MNRFPRTHLPCKLKAAYTIINNIDNYQKSSQREQQNSSLFLNGSYLQIVQSCIHSLEILVAQSYAYLVRSKSHCFHQGFLLESTLSMGLQPKRTINRTSKGFRLSPRRRASHIPHNEWAIQSVLLQTSPSKQANAMYIWNIIGNTL